MSEMGDLKSDVDRLYQSFLLMFIGGAMLFLVLISWYVLKESSILQIACLLIGGTVFALGMVGFLFRDW